MTRFQPKLVSRAEIPAHARQAGSIRSAKRPMNALNRSTFAMVLAVSLQQVVSTQLQLIPARDAQLFYIHHHLYVSNIDAQMKFWVDTLGATPVGKFPHTQIEVVKFRNVYVSLSPQAPPAAPRDRPSTTSGFRCRTCGS